MVAESRSDAESSRRTFLRAFEKADVDKAKRLWEQNPIWHQNSGCVKAHPLLKEFVDSNDGHLYRKKHLVIADMLTPANIQLLRNEVLANDVQGVSRRLEADRELIAAEFCAGRGIAMAVHHWQSPEMGELLLEFGADVSSETTVHGGGETALTLQVRNGLLANAELLLEHGAEPNSCNVVLMPSACMEEMIQLLLRHGWNIGGGGLLHDANHGHGNRLKTWLRFGADPNVLDSTGKSALHLLAVRGGGRQAIEALLAAGADPTLQDHLGKTALDYARNAKSKVALKTLEEAVAT